MGELLLNFDFTGENLRIEVFVAFCLTYKLGHSALTYPVFLSDGTIPLLAYQSFEGDLDLLLDRQRLVLSASPPISRWDRLLKVRLQQLLLE